MGHSETDANANQKNKFQTQILYGTYYINESPNGGGVFGLLGSSCLLIGLSSRENPDVIEVAAIGIKFFAPVGESSKRSPGDSFPRGVLSTTG
jgi:hypothetical protein